MVDVDEDKRWEAARLRLNDLGTVPSTFSSLIRAIRTDISKSSQTLSHISTSEVKRLLRSPATLAPFLAALKEFKPQAITEHKDPVKAVLSAFQPDEICALVNCIYLTKQVKKRIDPEEWKFICEILNPAVTIAGHLGATIKAIGFERAIFTVSASILGLSLFFNSVPKNYMTYRRILKKNNSYFNTEEELKLFSCSGREICSLLAQSIALSSTLASEYLSGLEPKQGERPATATQALTIWMKSLYSKGTAPQEAMDVKWYPNKSEVDQIEALTKRTQSSSQLNGGWLLEEASSLDALLAEFTKISGGSTEEAKAELDESQDL